MTYSCARKIFFILNLPYLLSRLGSVAVHGIMGGFTDFSVGLVRNDPVMIPIDVLVAAGAKKMKRRDYDW